MGNLDDVGDFGDVRSSSRVVLGSEFKQCPAEFGLDALIDGVGAMDEVVDDDLDNVAVGVRVEVGAGDGMVDVGVEL